MKNNNQPIKYFLYCRKSSEDKGRQILSLESQTNEMKKLADDLGLNIHKIFTESKSAKMPDNRPKFNEMIDVFKNSKEGERYGILCWKIDRLSRNPIDSATIQWLLQQKQLQVIQTAERQYLPSDNVVLFSVESSMANQYILDLSRNIKRGNKTKLEKGGWPNLAPIGYLNDYKGGLTIDEQRASYIRRAFALYATGNYGLKDITDLLYNEGLRSRGGKKYHLSKIHQILKNPFYYGIMECLGKQYLGNHEPLITEKLFNQTKAVFEQKQNPRKRTHDFLYKGLLKCANCGCAIVAVLKKERYVYYYCRNGKGKCEEHKSYLKELDVNELMADFMKNNLEFKPKLIDLCYKASLEKIKGKGSYLAQTKENLEKQIQILTSKQDRLLDTLLNKTISEEVYQAKDKKIPGLFNTI